MPSSNRSLAPRSARRDGASLRLAVGFAALGAFGALLQGVRRRRLRRLDRAVRRATHPRHDPALTTAAQLVSAVARPHVHPAIATAIAGAAWPRVGRRALLIPIASLASITLDRTVRDVVHQHRPPGAAHHPGRDRYAFPSGHTTATTAIALVTAIELRDRVTPASRTAINSLALAGAVMVGASRLYLDEHWADDVLGGWLAGTAIACLLTGIAPRP